MHAYLIIKKSKVPKIRQVKSKILSYEIRFVDDVISAYPDKEQYLPNTFYASISHLCNYYKIFS